MEEYERRDGDTGGIYYSRANKRTLGRPKVN